MKMTKFRKAWIFYRKTKEFREVMDELKAKGIAFKYRQNIIFSAFTCGWNCRQLFDSKVLKP